MSWDDTVFDVVRAPWKTVISWSMAIWFVCLTIEILTRHFIDSPRVFDLAIRIGHISFGAIIAAALVRPGAAK